MENAKVGLFEDHPVMRMLITMQLASFGHRVVLEAQSLESALSILDKTEPGTIDVAIVDADLGMEPTEGDKVIKRIRQNLGGIAIIGISAADPPEGADIKISKMRTEEIVDYINSL
jgi:CheY-like chemotaxis protein